MPARPHRTYACRDVVLDLDRGSLRRGGQDIQLRPKSFQVLAYLMERHGRLVGREDLVRTVWPDTFVSDDSLTKCLNEIRRALEDERRQIVKTVPRRGYIFDGPIEERGFDADVLSPHEEPRTVLPEREAPLQPKRSGMSVLSFPKRCEHNLPAQLTSFVGRAEELVEVVRLLRTERLLTLTGAGGCGKTRLALEAAWTLVPDFADGVWLTELASLGDERMVADAVARSLGLRSEGEKPILQRLSEHLKTRSLLLVIDNCEHLLGACAELVTLVLRNSSAVRVLATSREPLRIAGERAWRVPSLSLPAAGGGAEDVTRAEAVQLLIARASAVDPSFGLTVDNARTIAGICTRLDGIPLAIELAAARGKVLTVDQIAARLDDRFRLLVGGSRTALPRQQTLQATIEWSHDLLTDSERQLFRRLSVFAGGWTLETATEVCSLTRDDFETLDALSGLVDKSLVFADDDEMGGRRFRMLETVRQYGHDRLRDSGEYSDVRDRHLACFRRLAAAARHELKGPDQSKWLRRLRREHDNFAVALGWSEAAADGADASLELSAGLHLFWFKHGQLNEARRWLKPALARPASETLEVKSLAANCWFALGLSTILTGSTDEGRHCLETSLRLARELGDDGLAVVVLRMFVQGLVEVEEIEAAETCAAEALTIAERVRRPWERATALGSAGILHRAKCDYETAAQYFQDELATWRLSGDAWMMAASAADTAEAELHRGNVDTARTLTLEVLQTADPDDAPILAWNLEIFARALAAAGYGLLASRVWGAAETVYERVGLTTPRYWVTAYEQAVSAARTAVGDVAAFTAAWQEGRRMTPAEATACAIEAATGLE